MSVDYEAYWGKLLSLHPPHIQVGALKHAIIEMESEIEERQAKLAALRKLLAEREGGVR